MPRRDVIEKYARFFFIIGHSCMRVLMAKGVKTVTATSHRKNARVTGGILSLKPLATIKFPDHKAVAPKAKR